MHTVDWIILWVCVSYPRPLVSFSFRGSVQAVAHLCIIGIIKANIKFGYNNGMAAFYRTLQKYQ